MEDYRSQNRRLISCDAMAARGIWDEIRASRDTGYLKEAERKANPERQIGRDRSCKSFRQ